MAILPAFGSTMNQAMPARCGSKPSGLTAVSSAPHSLPFAYVTCCIRVSFESGLATTSVPLALCAVALTSSRQQPVPAMVTVVAVFSQKPWGTFVVGGEPDPGCVCFGGIAYVSAASTLLLRLSAGVNVFRDEV